MRRISIPRVLLAMALLLTAFMVQVSFLSRIGLPGATPDLVLVVVIGLAMASGPTFGAIAGFAAGLALELAPPAHGSLGQMAALFAIAGFLAGHMVLQPGWPDVFTMISVVGLAVGVCLATALLGAFVGSPQVNWGALPVLVITQAIYAAALSVFVLPLVGFLSRGTLEEGRIA